MAPKTSNLVLLTCGSRVGQEFQRTSEKLVKSPWHLDRSATYILKLLEDNKRGQSDDWIPPEGVLDDFLMARHAENEKAGYFCSFLFDLFLRVCLCIFVCFSLCFGLFSACRGCFLSWDVLLGFSSSSSSSSSSASSSSSLLSALGAVVSICH